MSPRRRAGLALLASCAALLGTSAPEPVFVSTPPAEVSVPANATGRLRVVVAPPDDVESASSRHLLAVALARPSGEGVEVPPDAKMLVRVDGGSGPPVTIPLRAPGVPDPRAAVEPRPGVPPSEEGTTRLSLPVCASPEPCVTFLSAWTEPPIDAVLVVRRPTRAARRSGIFPFDGPDVEGTREEELEELQLYPLEPAPAPAVMAAPP